MTTRHVSGTGTTWHRHVPLAGFLAVTLLCGSSAAGQAPASVAPPGDTTSIVPGPAYDVGWFYRIFWGDHWRSAWTEELRVPVLDLERYAGGLTPLSSGGRKQTKSLWFRGADGLPYAFRSVFKYASAVVPEVFRGTFVEYIAQDQMSTQFPAGALVADSILTSAGVLHARPELVVLPDDSSLGPFRDEFAGELGLLQQRPEDDDEWIASFAGAEEIIGGREMIGLAHNDPRQRVDARAFLMARLIDIYLGDWDRHAGQWRWARFGADSTPGWKPIPEDRDQVFARISGLFPSFARTRFQDLSSFGRTYDDVVRLHYTARFLDRLFLTGLERPAWDSAAAHLASRVTDGVIAGSVARLPGPLRDVAGEDLRSALEERRDNLPRIAAEFYELLARQPYVHATNAADIAEVSAEEGATRVTLRDARPGSEPYLSRRFVTDETREIRLFLWGGDDRVVVRGAPGLPVQVRIVGGDGDDEYHFATRTGNVRLYDQAGTNRLSGATGSIRLNEKPYDPPVLVPPSGAPAPPRHWGTHGYPMIGGGYNPDFGLIVGGGYTWNHYGFRKDPFGSQIRLSGAVATKGRGSLDLQTDFRFENSRFFVRANPYGSSLEILNFYGVGNDTERLPGASKDFYEVLWTVLRADVEVGWDLGPRATVALGGAFQYSNETDDPDSFIGQLPDLYGREGFIQTSGFLRFHLATDRPGLFELASPAPSARLEVLGRVVPALGDVTDTYGLAQGQASAAIPIGLRRSELGFRVGGKRVWGDAPWFDLAYIGGAENLRGWPTQRFAGDASLYGGGELRLDLFDYRLLLPSSFGILGLFDLGRVWLDGDSPGGFHIGYGGGIWIAIRGTRSVLSFALATSDEETGLYVSMGFAF
jgi:hypothetical protein